jgi:uncharacterized alpha-E superfamily protein
MISRIADHCLWLGRYLERAESTARVLFVTRNFVLDAEPEVGRKLWRPVIIVLGEEQHFDAHCQAGSDGEVVQHYMVFSLDNLSSLLRLVGAARENARAIREAISLEVWETLNELHLWLHSAEARTAYDERRFDFYRQVRRSLQLCMAQTVNTMLHDTPLDFIRLGVMLERVSQTGRLLDVHHHTMTHLAESHQVVETALWVALLRGCSGLEPFLKRNPGRVSGRAVAEFLLFEAGFPRSVRYCLRSAHESLCKILAPTTPGQPGEQGLAQLVRLCQWLEHKAQGPLDESGLHGLVTHVVDETDALCTSLGRELLFAG